MKRKILYISGSRADYGLMRSVLSAIHLDPSMDLHVAVTGMHLMPEFGSTLEEIKQDGYSCHVINARYEGDSRDSMALFLGIFIQEFVPLVKTLRPDIILILGDRGEMLGGAIVGAYMGIPVVHIHGGEVTTTVDEFARHAITKLSHIHLPATEESARRIIKMGEDPDHVFVVGAPGLDQILLIRSSPPGEIMGRCHLDPDIPVIIVLQHPVPLETGDPAIQMDQTLKAVCKTDCQILVIYPNADAGGRAMIEVIKKYASRSNIHTFPSLEHVDFLNLLKNSSVLVGNSSSGIIEAPSFGVPVVNIGSRQRGRQRGENVIDTGHNPDEIELAVNRALHDNDFKTKVKTADNPYGDGDSSGRIVKILKNIEITPDLLQKRMMY
jgi:GDP/UDP-N,N'-diacetylbacillosamine 2-epimerase (hydrolysing)